MTPCESILSQNLPAETRVAMIGAGGSTLLVAALEDTQKTVPDQG